MSQQCNTDYLHHAGCGCVVAFCDSVFDGLQESSPGISKEILPLPKVRENGRNIGALCFCCCTVLFQRRSPGTCSAKQIAPAIVARFSNSKELIGANLW